MCNLKENNSECPTCGEAAKCYGAPGLNTPEPMPTPNNYPALWDLVTTDMHLRDQMGTRKYGTRLQPHNGRNFLVDLYQEILDAAVYLRGLIYEKDGKPMDIETYLAHYRKFDAEFFPNAVVEEIEDKTLSEIRELHDEITMEHPVEKRITEALDVMNMSIKLLTAYGVKDVLHAGFQKLQLTAEKYRSAQNKTTT